jgi:hypothetical protein
LDSINKSQATEKLYSKENNFRNHERVVRTAERHGETKETIPSLIPGTLGAEGDAEDTIRK